MSKEPLYFDCPQCGHIDGIAKLRDHPTRPTPMDLGFCPECGGEVDEYLSEQQVRSVLEECGEDADAYLAGLSA